MWFMFLKPFILPILLGITLIGGGLYIKARLTDIETLRENNAKLMIAHQEQKLALEQKEIEIKRIIDSYERQKDINKNLEDNLKILTNKFNKIKADGSRRDLGDLLLKKGGLVEKIINKGTQEVFRCFEGISRNETDNSCNGINTAP